MEHIYNLPSNELSALCLLIAAIALFLAIILTVIHYTTRVVAGFMLGVAASSQGWLPAAELWIRDVAVPLLISVGALLLWGLSQLWEWVVQESGTVEVLNRFLE